MTALNKLVQAYDHKHKAALEWKENGGLVAACLGADVPEEMLIAAGVLPVRIFGDGAATDTADLYLEKGFDPGVRALFEQIVSGSYRYADRLFISNSSDALIRVYYYLRAMREAEPDKPVPDLYFYDFLHTRYRMSALYNRARTDVLLQELEKWTGKRIAREDLAAAIDVCNRNRELLNKVAELRTADRPRISGANALRIIGSSMVTPVREHNEWLRRLLEEAPGYAPLDGVRLFFTGSAHDHPEFYELAESCGGIVVGEDHDKGDRHYAVMTDPNVDPIDAIVDRYQFRSVSSSQGTVTERTAELAKRVRETRAEGVIAYIHESDDAPSWDFPEQRKALEAMGVSVLLLDRQPYRLRDDGGERDKIGRFIQSIRERKATGEGVL
ncbi:2-hydroxyacyl-CoA dehydratase subunit D [Cohnella caldifontis]|uniref:2-hydroxyacyl-CoA dehydratase subunit D n=1 Tax=Cohnella caldifontis TaxID=3027471 RepID=UPI0023EDAB3C|nr:2-hydroxyacyl-CoA dehydratase family protein [Cohnella sp. YIM B05605]